MNILVLHSDIAPGAPPDEQDTMVAARAVAASLTRRGDCAALMPFASDVATLRRRVAGFDMVFNLVEGIEGKGALAPLCPQLLAAMGVPFTGVPAAAMRLTNDKPLTKQMLRQAGIATPDWSLPPDWAGLDGRAWIVKSALEDGSIGLDDASVAVGAAAARARARACTARFGGDWFAEEYIEGREFNISLLGGPAPRILPMAEMCFSAWPADKPRIVGYGAKWEEGSPGWRHTERRFGLEAGEPALAAGLSEICRALWRLFGLRGFARVDLRVRDGVPLVLEVNANPCISPDAGFAAAGAAAGLSYEQLVGEIVRAAMPGSGT